jgi:hypothetical protein
MSRARLLLAAVFTVTFALAATGFRDKGLPSPSVGSITPAAPMLAPRSGQTATLLPDGTMPGCRIRQRC